MKKLFVTIAALVLTMSIFSSAFACTALYVGSDFTEDGTTMFGRIEDLSTDYNKLFNIVPSGKHTAGELYQGCYGFSYTFTHDSYGYTARRDDNLSGVCPDCKSTHDHTPYEEAGTNEKGVMVSATESLHGMEAVQKADPCPKDGMEEAEITTILLSEAATAKEGVELLTSIWATYGSNNGSGVFVADKNETWFVESMTGHSYIAVKLSSSSVFMQPNIATIGKINLNDTENVVASDNLIAIAQQAGTFVGDAGKNIIDFNASYNGESKSSRMSAGLNYLYGEEKFAEDTYAESDFALTNCDEEGNIVAMHSNITLAKKFAVSDALNFFKTEPIGKTGNVETTMFQVNPKAEDTLATIEWTSFAGNVYNVFVPYYPALTTELSDTCMKSADPVTKQDEAPASGKYYQNSKGKYVVYPEGWTDSYYGAFDALNLYLTNCDVSDDVKASVKAEFAAVQEEIYSDFAAMQQQLAEASSLEEKQSIATSGSKAMAEKAYAKALELYISLTGK